MADLTPTPDDAATVVDPRASPPAPTAALCELVLTVPALPATGDPAGFLPAGALPHLARLRIAVLRPDAGERYAAAFNALALAAPGVRQLEFRGAALPTVPDAWYWRWGDAETPCLSVVLSIGRAAGWGSVPAPRTG
jgi:hypothetical protein